MPPDFGIHTPTDHGILGRATDDLEEVKEASDAGIVEDADESVLRTITNAAEGLSELPQPLADEGATLHEVGGRERLGTEEIGGGEGEQDAVDGQP